MAVVGRASLTHLTAAQCWRRDPGSALLVPCDPAASFGLPDEEVPFLEILAQISRAKGSWEPEQQPSRPSKPAPAPPPDPESTPFLKAVPGDRLFWPDIGFLPKGPDIGTWDRDRIMAPARAWPSEGCVAELYDTARQGMPSWKPGGLGIPDPAQLRACSKGSSAHSRSYLSQLSTAAPSSRSYSHGCSAHGRSVASSATRRTSSRPASASSSGAAGSVMRPTSPANPKASRGARPRGPRGAAPAGPGQDGHLGAASCSPQPVPPTSPPASARASRPGSMRGGRPQAAAEGARASSHSASARPRSPSPGSPRSSRFASNGSRGAARVASMQAMTLEEAAGSLWLGEEEAPEVCESGPGPVLSGGYKISDIFAPGHSQDPHKAQGSKVELIKALRSHSKMRTAWAEVPARDD